MKNYRPLLVAGGLIFIFIGLIIYRLPDKTASSDAKTELSFSESQKQVSVGQDFTLEVVADPHGNSLLFVEPHLKFDPALFTVSAVMKTDVYPNVLSTETVGPGTATITVGSPSLSQPVTVKGITAKFVFHPLAPVKNSVISFDDNSFVGGALGSAGNKNMLAKKDDIVVTVVN